MFYTCPVLFCSTCHLTMLYTCPSCLVLHTVLRCCIRDCLVLSYLQSYYVVYLSILSCATCRLIMLYTCPSCTVLTAVLLCCIPVPSCFVLPAVFQYCIPLCLVLSYLQFYYVVYLSALSCPTCSLTMLYTCLPCFDLPAVLLCCIPVCLVLTYLPSYYVVYLSV